MIDFKNSSFVKMARKDEYAHMVDGLLLEGEEIVSSFQAVRDGVVFTTKRIIAVNVKGLTGRKKDVTSLPYKTIAAFSVETAGTLDLDSELEIYVSPLGRVKFEFTGETNLQEITLLIAEHSLK